MSRPCPSCNAFDSLDDGAVPGAATNVALEVLHYFFVLNVRLTVQKCFGHHQEAGSTKSTLQRLALNKGFLQGVEGLTVRKPLDRGHG
jgi:hypothetical protein